MPCVLVFGGGTFGRYSGCENGALRNGMGALRKETLGSCLAPPVVQPQFCEPRSELRPDTESASAFITGVLASGVWEVNAVEVTQSVVFLLQQPKWTKTVLCNEIISMSLQISQRGKGGQIYVVQSGKVTFLAPIHEPLILCTKEPTHRCGLNKSALEPIRED